MSANFQELIDRLASLYGIESEYIDIWGNRHLTSLKTKLAILEALGVETGSEEGLRRGLSVFEGKSFLEPVLVRDQGELPQGFTIHLSAKPIPQSFEVEISGSEGKIWSQGFKREELVLSEENGLITCYLPLPDSLPIGYYELRIWGGPGENPTGDSLLVVHPGTVYLPEFLEGEGKTWGLFFPLYALRSRKNWGIGDFRDLKELLPWIGEKLRAGFVGINPLHAIKNRRPYHLSPYFPSSRSYRNFLYLDVEAIPEFRASPQAQRLVKGGSFQRKLETLRSSPLVDYESVATLKLRVLQLLFNAFLEKAHPLRERGFLKYREREGKGLEDFATFQALSEEFPDQVWLEWPQGYQDPQSQEVSSFRESRQQRILFWEYVQWNIDEQLGELRVDSQKWGMPLGLYEDLALGVERCGADTWSNPQLFSLKAELGAPPDGFFPMGQRWGLPPVIPTNLRQERYQSWIYLLRHNLPPGGVLRIDHVMGLFHTFWVPSGMTPKDGAYVRGYPKEVLAILALESHLNKALIVGEDLGTVPTWVRSELSKWGILSSKIFYFERGVDGWPTPPEEYPPLALASINTHDMPTFKGFWELKDIELREELRFYPQVELAEEERRGREDQKRSIVTALRERGLLTSGAESERGLLEAVISWLALTPCKLLILNIWDLLGEEEQQNLPGTIDEHPNWTRKVSQTIEQIMGDSWFAGVAHLVNRLRGG